MKKATGDIWNKKGAIRYLEHHMTIEVVDSVVVQVAGKRNASPTAKDKKIIRKWAKQVGFSIDEELL